MSKTEKQPQPRAQDGELNRVRDFFSQNVETPIDRDQVKKIGQELLRQPVNSALILKVMKQDYKCGMNMQQLKEGLEEEPKAAEAQEPTPSPKATEKAVAKAVETAITDEAVARAMRLQRHQTLQETQIVRNQNGASGICGGVAGI